MCFCRCLILCGFDILFCWVMVCGNGFWLLCGWCAMRVGWCCMVWCGGGLVRLVWFGMLLFCCLG